MTETPLRATFEFFYSMFPFAFFLQWLEVLAAAMNSLFGIFGLDLKVLAF
jgi:hypothetical protein